MKCLHHFRSRPPVAPGAALLALVFAGDLARAYQGRSHAQGWEYEWVARASADGKRYSFPDDARWLFDPANPADRTNPSG